MSAMKTRVRQHRVAALRLALTGSLMLGLADAGAGASAVSEERPGARRHPGAGACARYRRA